MGKIQTVEPKQPVQLYAWPGAQPVEVVAVGGYLDVYPDAVGTYRQVEYRDKAAWANMADLVGAGVVPDRAERRQTQRQSSRQGLSDALALAALCDMVLPIGAPERSNDALIRAVGALLQKTSCTVIEQAIEKGAANGV